MLKCPPGQITRMQQHVDQLIEHLQSTIGSQLQEILEFMHKGDAKKGGMIDYKKLEEQKRRAKYKESKRAEERKRQDEEQQRKEIYLFLL